VRPGETRTDPVRPGQTRSDPVRPGLILWSARDMGEMPFVPLAPAIAAAVCQATGIWFDSIPLTTEMVLWGLGRLGYE